MANLTKHYVIQVLYGVGFMFCSGAILQTFLLQVGFTEQQVYLFNSFIQMIQVLMMVVMTFLSDKIKRIKTVSSLSYLPLIIFALIFIIGAVNPSIMGNPYTIAVFIVAGLSYIGVGVYSVMLYILPYVTIDMKEYGKMTSIGVALTGGFSFGLSFIHTFIVAKFDYMTSMVWFFICAILCFIISSIVCYSMKEFKVEETRVKNTKEDMIAVFKNKDTYILLFPNFARGIATGVMNVITVIAIATSILDEKSSSIVNIIMQVGMLGGNVLYAIFCKKISSETMLLISTIGCCIALPLSLLNGMTWFFIVFFICYFFRMIMDTAIPVMVTEIIPKEQIGAFTSIRMLVFTGAQAVATLIIMPTVSVVGYTGLLIFSAILQFIFGITYWAVAKRSKCK